MKSSIELRKSSNRLQNSGLSVGVAIGWVFGRIFEMWFVQTAWVAPCQRAPGSIAGLPFPTSMRPRRVGAFRLTHYPRYLTSIVRAFCDRHRVAHRITVED